ncbi:aldose epimerase family protein [Novosphingobium piscinae]|uniref:Aldose 1-epimerase n=1 Tax=Novosphingobium piscinae TaxID=1507448 RepID=A0A7X1FVH8_9SPHN|nr:aldose epimerase family protein [Novosphingobium piscinae]MBC2667759.1 galactose mutarotase [Novosphingobium piscinae]
MGFAGWPIRRAGALFPLLAGVVQAPASVQAAEARQDNAGQLADGSTAQVITLTAANGVSAKVLSYGATLQSLIAPDRDGKLADVLLGYDTVQAYEAHPSFFGVTVGRYANRIAGGRFTLDGQTFQLPLNDKTNSLHGGVKGFDKRNWQVVAVRSGPVASVRLSYVSADGEEGFPGTLRVAVTYALDDQGGLTITFEATTDKSTVVNLTNHALFNLAGDGAPVGAMGHRLTIPAARYTPVDARLIPTGELRPVAGSVFDFREPRRIADGLRDASDQQILFGRGYDHNFVIDKGLTAQPGLVARLEDPESGRVLDVLSTEPGVQLYTGNFLDGTVPGKSGRLYRMGDGLALEPQKFPDSPNQPGFISARVDPGQTYRHVMIYRMSTAPRPR